MSAALTISRTGNKLFRYFDSSGQQIHDRRTLVYYKSLRIPPAWEQVRIAKNHTAKVLATGIDAAGRRQYIYHPNFRAKQEQAKFERILRFARALPRMRQVIDADMQRPQLDYKKVMASIVSIMDRTYIRVGNDSYARDNQSYGLTTLRSKHTSVTGDTITFDFIGKSGKHQVRRVSDRSLARIVRQLDNLPGYEVFKYYDFPDRTPGTGRSSKITGGILKDVKSSDVNNYIKDVMGEEFSAKDFRTWAGTLTASMELVAAERAGNERERKKAITACVRKVAAKLGNTPAVARSSYIDPRILNMFLEGDDLRKVRDTVSNMKQQKGRQYLSQEERWVLGLLEG